MNWNMRCMKRNKWQDHGQMEEGQTVVNNDASSASTDRVGRSFCGQGFGHNPEQGLLQRGQKGACQAGRGFYQKLRSGDQSK